MISGKLGGYHALVVFFLFLNDTGNDDGWGYNFIVMMTN